MRQFSRIDLHPVMEIIAEEINIRVPAEAYWWKDKNFILRFQVLVSVIGKKNSRMFICSCV